MQIKLDGVVLMQQELSQGDRLISILTVEEGLINAFVKVGRNDKNRNASATQLFCYSDFVLYKGKDKYIVNQVELREMFWGLRADIVTLALAQYFCEIVRILIHEGPIQRDVLRLVLNAFYLLCRKIDPLIVKAVLEMRMLAMEGYMPDVLACKICGGQGKNMCFITSNSCIICEKCTTNSDLKIHITPAALAALRHVLYADFPKMFFFSMSRQNLLQLSALSENYTIQCVGKNLKTLEFLKRISPE